MLKKTLYTRRLAAMATSELLQSSTPLPIPLHRTPHLSSETQPNSLTTTTIKTALLTALMSSASMAITSALFLFRSSLSPQAIAAARTVQGIFMIGGFTCRNTLIGGSLKNSIYVAFCLVVGHMLLYNAQRASNPDMHYFIASLIDLVCSFSHLIVKVWGGECLR